MLAPNELLLTATGGLEQAIKSAKSEEESWK